MATCTQHYDFLHNAFKKADSGNCTKEIRKTDTGLREEENLEKGGHINLQFQDYWAFFFFFFF